MKALSLIAAVTLALAPPLWAKDKDHHADPKHGGVAAEAGKYHLELVAKDKTLSLHVYGHDDKPLDAAKARAQANVFSGKDKGNVALTPAGGNVMKGEAAFAIRPDAKIVLTFTPAEGKAEQARFQLGAKPDHKGHKH